MIRHNRLRHHQPPPRPAQSSAPLKTPPHLLSLHPRSVFPSCLPEPPALLSPHTSLHKRQLPTPSSRKRPLSPLQQIFRAPQRTPQAKSTGPQTEPHPQSRKGASPRKVPASESGHPRALPENVPASYCTTAIVLSTPDIQGPGTNRPRPENTGFFSDNRSRAHFTTGL